VTVNLFIMILSSLLTRMSEKCLTAFVIGVLDNDSKRKHACSWTIITV